MKKQLKSNGNGWEFYFTKQLLKLVGYNPKNMKVLITAKNSSLLIEPVKEADFDKFEDKMLRNFQKSGGSYAIYLPQTLIEVLEIDPAVDFVDIDIDEQIITIKKRSN